MRRTLVIVLSLWLAACSGVREEDGTSDPLATDPLVARALHDPLMSDPDLSARNEANALLGFAADSGLPLIPATPEAAQAAREAGRLELLEQGEIPPLPAPVAASGSIPGAEANAADLLAALDAPEACLPDLSDDFAWAADLPEVAAIMPHGMVMRAAGARRGGCNLRLISYRTPAAAQDVLQYHFTRAVRAGLRPEYHSGPDSAIVARGRQGAVLVVVARPSATGHNAVDLLVRLP
ncbi:MAG: hypothetical protein V2I74_06875 [Erythrobacter sp.]|jgi:hypothetical protein|nr:hypothetical protein [Erythrobacter sp.]